MLISRLSIGRHDASDSPEREDDGAVTVRDGAEACTTVALYDVALHNHVANELKTERTGSHVGSIGMLSLIAV